MNVLKVVFDLSNKQGFLDTSNFFGGNFAEIHFCLAANNVVVPPDLKFEFSLQKDNEQLAGGKYPQFNARYETADSMPLAIEKHWFVAEHSYRIGLLYEFAGEKIETSFNFVPSRPPQPYPSWSWNDGFWQPPVKKPINGPYNWDEPSQTWIPDFPPDSVYASMAQYGNEQIDPETGKVVRALNDENHKPSPFGSPGVEITLKRS